MHAGMNMHAAVTGQYLFIKKNFLPQMCYNYFQPLKESFVRKNEFYYVQDYVKVLTR
jgi:hypothetical protein